MNLSGVRSHCVLLALLLASGAIAAQEPSAFIRFLPGSEEWQGRLQTAITSYRNEDGVSVELVAALHIADAEYYEFLNDYFSSRDEVLYELVADPEDRPTPGSVQATSSISFVQVALANFLQVSFQLQAVDYSPANFVHADLSPEELLEIMAAKDESFFSMFFSLAMAQMESEQAALENGAEPSALTLISLINAMLADDHTSAFKYLFAEELGRAEGLMIGPGVEDQLTILGERNRVALEVLEESLALGNGRRISIFYGAAHMPGLERVMLSELGFSKTAQRWITAWEIP